MLTSIVRTTVVRPGLIADHAMMAARSQLRLFLTQLNSKTQLYHTRRSYRSPKTSNIFCGNVGLWMPC
jgi:hypothetical protein